jgi:minor extracellular serine protease Vpr
MTAVAMAPTAGIVGANGTVKGVAPGVTFGAYRVFGCSGSTDSDIIIAAMERALTDGMDVVNQSLGAAYQWSQYPTAKAADRLVKAGVVMVASIGNSGASGVWTAGAPGVGKEVIGVASYDNTTIDLRTFSLSSGGSPIGYYEATGAPASPTEGSAPLARTGTTTSVDDGCAVQPEGSLTGKVALIRRGTCSFYQKSFNAQTAGAVGVVLYNNVPGYINPTVAGTPAITIPVVSISAADGAVIDAQIQAGPVSLVWSPDSGNFSNPTGGLISSFSSYGLAPDLTLKPNLGAPGGAILSTYPLESGGYAVLSGTSMSSPNVAGTVALMLQARPNLKPEQIKTLLQNGAEPKAWSLNAASGLIDAVHRQGAGMIDVIQSLKTKVGVSPSELSLGEGQAGPVTRTLTLKNQSNTPVTYALSNVGGVGTTNTFVPSYWGSVAGASFSAPTVTVPAKGTATVDVTLTAPPATSMPDRGIYGGYVVFTDQAEGGQSLRVPYAGLTGDYQSIPVLTSGGNGFPWLAQLSGGFFNNQPSGGTFTMAGDDIPYFLVHLDHYGRQMKLTAYDSVTGKAVGEISKDQYLPRNSTSTGFFSFTWDGTMTTNGYTITAPNGTYTVKISLLKALGSAANTADWETWTSPTVTLARP